MSLLVREPGLQSLVVDFGRPRSRALGVPVGGAADRAALSLGNALVGNPPDASALEVAFVGPTLEAQHPIAAVIFGAPFQSTLNGTPLTPGTTFQLDAGDVLRVGGTATGARAYLCVAGGFDVPEVMGSRSALDPLRAGEVLRCAASRTQPRALPFCEARSTVSLKAKGRLLMPSPLAGEGGGASPPGEGALSNAVPRSSSALDRSPLTRLEDSPPSPARGEGEDNSSPLGMEGNGGRGSPLRVLDGPQRDWFTDDRFFTQTYTVLPASNRMGVRLKGEPLSRRAGELVSEAVAPGAVQVTNDGLPIVLGADGQTIGGYPKVAHVIRADLDRLAQLRPGDRVRFVPVTVAEAEAAAREYAAFLRAWLTRLRIAERRPVLG